MEIPGFKDFLDKKETPTPPETKLPASQEERKAAVFGEKEPEKLASPEEIEKARLEAKKAFELLGKEEKEADELEKKRQKEIKEIMGSENFDTVKASSVLYLKEKGVDLALYFLVNQNKPETPVAKDAIAEGMNFCVNFGKNDHTNYIIGAGDLLPPTIREVEINGVKGTRKTHPRPGYYTQDGEYLPVFDGDKIKIKAKRDLTPEEKAAEEAAIKGRFEYVRVQDSLDNGGAPLSQLPEDQALKKKIESTKAEYAAEYNAAGQFGIVDPERPTKVLKNLSFVEATALLRRVFGEGEGTNLMIKEAEGSAVAISRMICLAYHEGSLKFGRQNSDPASGYNYGTFQIGGYGSNPVTSLQKYKNCLKEGLKRGGIAANTKGIDNAQSLAEIASFVGGAAQADLITHIGYIHSQRPDGTFEQLRDPNLSRGALIRLMSTTIQGGIDDIGRHVASLMENKVVSL